MMLDLSIIIPAKNEADNLPALLQEIIAIMTSLPFSWEVIVVNDGSSDSSWSILQDHHRRFPQIKAIDLEKSVGQSFAMVQGAQRAQGRDLIFLDADGQNPPSEIPFLLEPHFHTPCVFGVRKKRRDQASKRFVSYLANRFRMWLIQDGAEDTGCSLKKIPRDLFLTLPRFHGMHRFLPALVRLHGASYTQCLVQHRSRTQGTSHYHLFNRSFNVVQDLLGVLWLKNRQRHPVIQREILS